MGEFMPLNIYAIASHLPKNQEHTNLLGPVMRNANNHLFTPAGHYSRPTIVGRGSTRIAHPPYEAPTAAPQERAADLTCYAVDKLVKGLPQSREAVDAVLHSQCTLDQQISGSCCLRLQDEFFRNAELTLTIGQLGTAGIPTVFELTDLSLKPRQLACVSAADKWLAPFVRKVPDIVTYGDASAACLIGKGDNNAQPIATIEKIAVSCTPSEGDIWKTSAKEQRLYLFKQARSVIDQLLTQSPDVGAEKPILIGDSYGSDFDFNLSSAFQMKSLPSQAPDVHLSSAAPLFAISKMIAMAVASGRQQQAVIWTESQSGNAGAMLIRANPEAIKSGDAWLTPDTATIANNKT